MIPIFLGQRRRRRALTALPLIVTSAAFGTPVFAQGAAPVSNDSPAAQAGGASAGGETGGSAASQPQFFPGGVMPPAAGEPVGGGNTSSYGKFDVAAPSANANLTVKGSNNGPIFMDPNATPVPGDVSLGTTTPGVHTVRKGDTLWGICTTYFQNPYQWPRVWAYNPQIHNPHYIEVGDLVKLRDASGAVPPAAPAVASNAPASALFGRMSGGRRTGIMPQTIFLREEGFVENANVDNWGEISGSPEDKTFLTDTDDLYLRVAPNHDVHIGQELTVFRPVRSAGDGKVVALLGTVRVNQYNARDRVARATVIETLDVIERGARVGNIPRRFEVVAPVKNSSDVEAKVIASVQFHTFYGMNQVVYIDKGSEDGLAPGNRLLITRKGDAWRQSLPNDSAARRIDIESDSPAHIENIQRSPDEKNYPEELVGELRVINTQKHTAMCVVTASEREIEVNEKAHARKGY